MGQVPLCCLISLNAIYYDNVYKQYVSDKDKVKQQG